MNAERRFMVVAFPTDKNDEPVARPMFVWGLDHYTPSVKGKWLKLKTEQRNLTTERTVWLMTSEQACKVRDNGIVNELCDEYSFRVIEAKECPHVF